MTLPACLPVCLSVCLTPVPVPPTPGLQESAQLRDKLSQLQLEVAENKGMLSELNLEVQQKTDRLAEVELRLKDCLAEKAQEEERLSRRLRDSHETIASLRAQSPPIKVSHRPGARAVPCVCLDCAFVLGPWRPGQDVRGACPGEQSVCTVEGTIPGLHSVLPLPLLAVQHQACSGHPAIGT